MAIEDAISIEGTLLMLDNVTPHVAVVVQAIRDGKVISTVLSDKRGRYQFTDLKPGQYQVRCYALDRYVYFGKDKPVDASYAASLEIQRGKALRNINFRFAPFKKGIWRTYNYVDGLAGNYVRTIYCDPDGVIWFGTHGGGISRYDGKEFINFTTEDGLGRGRISAICRDLDGVMWFGASGGISWYDGKEFVNLTTKDGLVGNNVRAINCDLDGAIWFGTDGGISRYDGKEFINLTVQDGLANNSVNAIYRDPDGAMWFGTDGGASRYDGKEFVNLTTENGLTHKSVSGICRDLDGVMWFATGDWWSGAGILRYDGKEFINFTIEDGLVNDIILTICGDPGGMVWFGTYGGGVSCYDGKGFINLTTGDGLANNEVSAIYRDPDGAMWFGTWGSGVSRYDPNKLVNFTTRDGLPDNRIRAIHRDPDGVMWFGAGWWEHGSGLSRYDGVEFVNFTTADGLVDDRVCVIFRDPDGIMWFGTVSGVSRYDGKEFVNIDQLADNWVGTIRRDLDGTMWFGTGWSRSKGSGVFRYDGKEFVNLTTADGLANNVVVDIYCDQDGVVWFATGGGGVSRYDGRKFVNLTTEDGLLSNRICNIYRDTDGLLWFASLGGVSRYDGKHFTNFTKEDGLASNDLNVTCDESICQDTDGVLWFATDGGGVSGYDDMVWTSLDTRDGLLDNRMGPILQDPDGYLWFASQGGGVTRYRKSTTAPKAHIVSVTTDQTYRDLSAIPAFTPGTRVTIEYNSIDLKTLLEKRQYRVRIREIDSDWRKPTRDTSLDFIFHEPGIYTFGVQAIDQDLNYSEPASVELIVQPDPALVSMKTELSYLRREVRSKYHFENIIGRSTGVREVRALMERAIDSGLTVLITGETGTGKELVAKAIHHNSPRRDQPILALNCGGVPKELITSSLFGHRKGAFTSAHEDQVGLFEAASGGTVLLDEIGEMPKDAQIQLLRVLEERVVQRIGEHTSREVDVRIMAMTNRDLMNEVTEGRFREDLYYRLSVFPIHIPPLRERVEDIPTLAEHFLHEYSQEQKKDLDSFAPDVLQMLQSYDWPGNVRELRNVIQRAAALAQEGDRIQTYHLPPQITRGEPVMQEILSEQMNLSTAVDHVQRRLVENALRESNGNRAQAARVLGLHRSNLVRLMKRLGIE